MFISAKHREQLELYLGIGPNKINTIELICAAADLAEQDKYVSQDILDILRLANEAVADDLTEELGDDDQPELPEDVMPAEEEAEPEEGEPVAVAEEEVPEILSTDEVLEEGDDD